MRSAFSATLLVACAGCVSGAPKMSLQALDSITSDAIEDAPAMRELIDAERIAAKDYVVVLTNISSWLVVGAERRNGPAWSYAPPIGKTCRKNDCRWCSDNRGWTPILTAACNDSPFDLRLLVKRGNQNGVTKWVHVSPDCRADGAIICLGP